MIPDVIRVFAEAQENVSWAKEVAEAKLPVVVAMAEAKAVMVVVAAVLEAKLAERAARQAANPEIAANKP